MGAPGFQMGSISEARYKQGGTDVPLLFGGLLGVLGAYVWEVPVAAETHNWQGVLEMEAGNWLVRFEAMVSVVAGKRAGGSYGCDTEWLTVAEGQCVQVQKLEVYDGEELYSLSPLELAQIKRTLMNAYYEVL